MLPHCRNCSERGKEREGKSGCCQAGKVLLLGETIPVLAKLQKLLGETDVCERKNKNYLYMNSLIECATLW
jgi:hypothetical protein